MKNLIVFVILLAVSLFSCKKESASGGEETISGTYRSVQGVMTPLSCYCFNSGYLTLADSTNVPVCFKDDAVVNTGDKLSLTGSYKTEETKPEPTSPCPAGTMQIFIVSKFEVAK